MTSVPGPSNVEQQIAAAKENLLAQIGHLRRVVDYDYPPVVIAAHMRAVQSARSSYATAWKVRDAERRGR